MRTILFCGDKWDYALALLESILKSGFNTVGVALPTLQKWHAVLEKHTGQKVKPYDAHKQNIKATIKKSISRTVLAKHPKIYDKILNSEAILREYGVPAWRVDDVNSAEFIDRLKRIEPDLILCAGFPQIFSRELVDIPKKGAVNFHPSLLPKYRGPSPFFWIIAKGETESGVTAHFMTEKIDGGDIIAQLKFPILGYTYDELVRKSMEETPQLIEKVYHLFSEGKLEPERQDDAKASYYRYDREQDRFIRWQSQDVRQIFNLTRTDRSLCHFRNRRIGIRRCSILETDPNLDRDVHADEGTIVLTTDDSLVIKAKNGYLNLQTFVYKRKTISARRFAKKMKLRIGEKFT